jgi:MFS family permease
MRLLPDGDALVALPASVISSAAKPLPGSLLWHDAKFLTIAAGMALGLFAQIGLTVHLYSLLVPALGATQAGFAMGLVTVMAIIGRSLIGWAMPADIDRRLLACASYAVQIAGCVAFIAAGGTSVPLLLLGVVLFGTGFGNGTWLPPLIAQVEFVAGDVPRAVALMVAISQGTYAFAPVVFGMIRESWPHPAGVDSGAAPGLFIVAGIVQSIAIGAFLAGRRRTA